MGGCFSKWLSSLGKQWCDLLSCIDTNKCNGVVVVVIVVVVAVAVDVAT